MLKFLLLISCLISIETVFCVDCSDYTCLRTLFNARVTKAEYYTRPLSSSSSSSSGWWPFSSRRKKRHNYHLHHAGVVVTIDRYVEGKNKWLIHKGEDYGDASDTVITDADYMSSRWTNTKTMYPSCRYTVNSCMRAARNDFVYSVYGPNCQTAANGIWDLLRSC
ncbi:uncharacterized protein LOC143042799 [Mytilus galloprovincialis]|uniref:uncharacterized protein LOC143042799 n=1 Tax=Mytilus galloprovincialis TaxID=29158 RepID=UPI003F7BBA32